MDYEKLHKETLLGLQKLVSEGRITEEIAKRICVDFVAESEDERIRKFLFELLSHCYWRKEWLFSSAECLAWLEKQNDVDVESIKNEFYNAGYEDGMEYMQKPAEWSEEDKKNLQGVIDEIEANKNTAPSYDIPVYDSFLSWLKSLRPNHWKPSEHQLEVLKLVAEKDGTCLMGLYNDLKKL